MQELLGRIAALDPEASLGLRVIACFDELVLGEVNTRSLLSAAAALAGCPAGMTTADGVRTTRVDPQGIVLDDPAPEETVAHLLPDGSRVWLERTGPAHVNDALVCERLALAVGIRLGLERHDLEAPRDVATIVDAGAPDAEREAAGHRVGLVPAQRYRVVAAPLFAVFHHRPGGVSDVVTTPHGPMQIVVMADHRETVDCYPAGVGPAATIADLPRSLDVAIVALRLARPPEHPMVRAEDFGGLVELLAGSPDVPDPDEQAVDALLAAGWGDQTIAALLENITVRQTARSLGLHHSTIQHRIDQIAEALGYDPVAGHNRTRLGISLLKGRLRTSRVLDLPAPGHAPHR